MKSEDQRIAIAEACGWEYVEDCYGWPTHADRRIEGNGMSKIPDYLNDLNAMHEAEKSLTLTDGGVFAKHLLSILDGEFPPDSFEDGTTNIFRIFDAAHATAEQRAEAFLKTLGLWKS